MKTYISVNVVSQALILLSSLQKHSCTYLAQVQLLKVPYGVNKEAAIHFLQQCAWIQIDNENIAITSIGENILHRFDGTFIQQDLWRTILAGYIKQCQPAWAKRIPFGRKEAYYFMNDEERRCFDEASLMSSTELSVIDWWDTLAETERSKKASSLTDIGREGERLTMAYETYHGATPSWISLDSNLAGYDILSQRINMPSQNILIEVKTSSKEHDNASCIITRHEWNTAQRQNNIARYYFYLWRISSFAKELAIIDVASMQKHIPNDSFEGKWESVSVPFSAFEREFRTITY